MSKVAKVVGVVAGVVAVVATGGAALGAFGAAGTIFGVSAGTIATIASVVSAAAMLASQALAKPPPARGSVNTMRVEATPKQPYAMGEGLVGGLLRHDTAWGPTLKKVPNPYRFMAVVYSGSGPIHSISPRVDFEAVSSWYNTFLFTDTQLGACPEADALSPQWAGTPDWGTAYKLSGQASIGWSFLFDKDGKRFASGIPPLGAYGKWVKVYDPRLDSSQPGGSGSHVLGDESTYEWSENPALHAGMYAYGRYQNGNGPLLDGTPATGKRVMGIGMPPDGIDWLTVMSWANVCDTNGWTIFGVLFEPDNRWTNLKDVCFAGGAQPIPGGVLTFKYHAPVVALDTITADDLTEDNRSVVPMQSYRDRLNTVVPQYVSADHNWEMVDAEPVVNSTFLTEDGEEKRDVWPFNFVKDKDQAAQLAAYRLFDTRELAPITLVCKSRMRHYRPGECLHVTLPRLGLDTDAIILTREIDPVTMKVTLTLMGETPSKHAYCLGQVGVAPDTPAIGQSAQERDELAYSATVFEAGTLKLSSSYTAGLAGNITQVHDGAGTGTVTVTIPDHTRVYADATEATVTGGDFTLDQETYYLLCYDNSSFEDGEIGVDFSLVTVQPGVGGDVAKDAYFSADNPSRHFLASITTVDETGAGGGSGGASPPGGGGWDGDNPGGNIP